MTKSDTEKKEPFVDRRSNRGGIRDGGRRKSDGSVPRGSSRIWFGLSMLLTIFIVGWTVTLAFQSEKPVLSWEEAKEAKYTSAVSPDIESHPEHGMSREQYMSYVMEIEANLQDELAEKNRVPLNLPDARSAKRKMQVIQDRWKSELKSLKAIVEKTESGEYDKRTVIGQRVETLRQRLAETES